MSDKDSCRSVRNTVAVVAAIHELSNCPAGSFLQRDTFTFGALAEGCLLLVGQP